MADDNTTNDVPGRQEPPEPSAVLKALDRLVGTWEMSGDIQGRNTYEWMEGGYFLIQRFDYAGRRIRGALSADGDTLTGAWRWPGGGYEANGTRVG
jgi:hypothetical protein